MTSQTTSPAARLSQAIQYPTVSTTDPAKFNPAPLLELHAYLQQAFPLVHAQLTRETVNQYSLLYTWPGRNPSLKPLLLAGHLDVVPVEAGTEKDWTYPPFGGQVAEGFIWGRGALDCKATVLGVLEAVENLLGQGFQPQRTILLGFGHDEEIGGMEGAAKIAQVLQERGVSLEAALDEGLAIIEGLLPGVKQPVALVGIAEKGYINLELTAEAPGGHSAMPPKEKSIVLLSRALQRLDKRPMPIRLISIIKEMFSSLAPALPPLLRLVVKNLWLFKPLFVSQLAKTPTGASYLRTTTAPTILRAGEKENVLPQKAQAVVNFRILPGDTGQMVIEHVQKVIADPHIRVETLSGFHSEPSPISDTSSPAYQAIRRAIQTAFKIQVVAPSLVGGGTDCRYYAPLTRNGFRFSPIKVTPVDLKRVHGTDERIAVQDYEQGIAFYQRVIESMGNA